MPHLVSINAIEERCGTALQAASIGNHGKVIQILLKTEADIKAKGGY